MTAPARALTAATSPGSGPGDAVVDAAAALLAAAGGATEGGAAPPVLETLSYAGTSTCGACHQPALAFWKTTKHARAVASLAAQVVQAGAGRKIGHDVSFTGLRSARQADKEIAGVEEQIAQARHAFELRRKEEGK